MFVHSFTFRPPRRFDAEPWTAVRIEESADNQTFAQIEQQPLSPLDADPSEPATRPLTTELATIAAGWFRVVWVDGDGDTSPPSGSLRSPGVGPDGYPPLDALLAASTVAALTSLAVEQQDGLRAEAIQAVEAYCGQAFTQDGTEAAPVTRSIDGSGNRTLYLPRRLATLTGLEIRTGPHEGSGSIDVADVEVSEDRAHLSIPGGFGSSSWATRAVAEIEGLREAVFPAGAATVRVSGVWGWGLDEFPAVIATALRFHMEDRAVGESHKLSETIRAARGLGLSDVRQGNVDFTLEDEPLLSARAKRAAANYVFPAFAGAVA